MIQYYLVLLCSGTYYLVTLFTIQEIPSFQTGTWYVKIYTAISTIVRHGTFWLVLDFLSWSRSAPGAGNDVTGQDIRVNLNFPD